MTQYIVSARKYRPDSFETLIGQDNIAQTLKNSILRGQLAHAYLFCGPRGVGKTTTARIFAKMINCSNPSADMDPCGQCESCLSFAEGRSYCIHELDAASNNGVEDIKTLMDQVRIPPQVGRYSVYIIDEVHMLSQAAFNAFLKTLEEPPAHAIFILATTEKHKILPTILSRCQTYDFNRITVENIVKNLRMVASRENVSIDDESLHVMLNLEHTVGRVVLVLLANKDVSNLGVADHVLDLRLARRGIERDGDRPDAIGAEVHIHTLRHVLREDGDVFLYTNTQFQQRCRHPAHCLCKFLPRDAFPSLLVVVAVKHGGTLAIDFGLALDKRGNWTWVLHSDSFFDMAKIRIN